jgi:class 3 adenylate cyclase
LDTDLVVILSSDWVGSTATRARIGEERADALQELHDTLLRRAIEAAHGKVVKHSGDGVLAIFRSATAALGAAVQIQRDFAAYRAAPDAVAPIDVRVGLAAGDVKQQSSDIFGMPVVEAVRLQSAAAPNEILCSDLVRMLSQGRGGFEFEDGGTFTLKGFTAPVHTLKVRRPENVAPEAPAHDRVPTAPSPATRAARSPRRIVAVACGGRGNRNARHRDRNRTRRTAPRLGRPAHWAALRLDHAGRERYCRPARASPELDRGAPV